MYAEWDWGFSLCWVRAVYIQSSTSECASGEWKLAIVYSYFMFHSVITSLHDCYSKWLGNVRYIMLGIQDLLLFKKNKMIIISRKDIASSYECNCQGLEPSSQKNLSHLMTKPKDSYCKSNFPTEWEVEDIWNDTCMQQEVSHCVYYQLVMNTWTSMKLMSWGTQVWVNNGCSQFMWVPEFHLIAI